MLMTLYFGHLRKCLYGLHSSRSIVFYIAFSQNYQVKSLIITFDVRLRENFKNFRTAIMRAAPV
jgi:hypothetical protein